MTNRPFGESDLGILSSIADLPTVGDGLRPPPPEELYSPDRLAERALSYAVEVSGEWIKDGEVYIFFLDEAVMQALKGFQAVHQTVGYGDKDKKLVGYKTPDISCDNWLSRFESSAEAARQIRRRLALNIKERFPMPDAAMEFASLLANGLPDPPTPAIKKTKLHRDTLLSAIAKRVHTAFKIPLGATKTRYDIDPTPICGNVFAASALHGHGVSIAFKRADEICRNPALPIEKLSEYFVLSPRNRLLQKNALRPTPPEEHTADAQAQFSQQYSKALKRLGHTLPVCRGYL